jgi:hypothetical protein
MGGGNAEPQWDATNPDVFYYFSEAGTDMKLYSYNFSTHTYGISGDFTGGRLPWANTAAVSTKAEGSPSADGRYWAFVACDSNWNKLGYFTWDKQTDTIIATMNAINGFENADHLSMCPSGNNVVMSVYGGPGAVQFTRNLVQVRQLATIGEHSDIALLPNGNDAYASVDYNNGDVYFVDMGTGAKTVLFSCYEGGGSASLHFSGKGYNKPGWIIMSSYAPGTGLHWFYNKVFAIELKPSARVYCLAHEHSVYPGADHYWMEPHASTNKDMTKILFVSNWDVSSNTNVDDYMINLSSGDIPAWGGPTSTPGPTPTTAPTASNTPTPTNTPRPTNTPTPLPTSTPTPLPTATPTPSGLITNLVVNDTANAADWSIQANLQNADLAYGDRTVKFNSMQAYLAGCSWIRPANDSKTYTGTTLCTFNVNANCDVYVLHNDAITTKPSWLSSWTDTGDNVTTDAPVTYSVFRKSYSSGSNVSLGNNGDTNPSTYIIVAKAASFTPTPTATNTPTPTSTPSPVTITLQQGVGSYSGAKDQGGFNETTADNSMYYGAGQGTTYFFRDVSQQAGNALIYFDLSQIPAGKTIDSATLSFYNTGSNAYSGGVCNMHRILDPNSKGMWVEGTNTDYTLKDGASWVRRTGTGNTLTTAWTNTANSTILNSCTTSATATITFSIASGWYTSTSLVSDVQAWVNGTAVNQGWYIRANPGGGVNLQYNSICSNHYATTANRPKLTITYH